jgi:hypothetical protein
MRIQYWVWREYYNSVSDFGRFQAYSAADFGTTHSTLPWAYGIFAPS